MYEIAVLWHVLLLWNHFVVAVVPCVMIAAVLELAAVGIVMEGR